MKRYILIAAAAAIAGALLFGFLRPGRTIETIKEIKTEVEDKKITESLRKQIATLKTEKSEIEKQLNKQIEENKNISTKKTVDENYGPDGKLISKKTTEETTDLTTKKTNTDEKENAKKESTEEKAEKTEAEKKAEDTRKTKEETTDRKQTDNGGTALRAGPNLDLSAILAGITIPLNSRIGIAAEYIFILPAPAIKADKAFISLEIRL